MTQPPFLPDFTPYGQLVAALLPRAAGLSLFNADGELRWASDGTVDPQVGALVTLGAAKAARHDEPGERVDLRHDEPVYLFWLRDEDGQPTAVACVSWRSGGDARTFSYVHAMLRPVFECLHRELHLQALIARAGEPAAATTDADDADLQVLLSTPDGALADCDIAQLLSQVNLHLKCDFATLMIPERNVLVVNKAEGCAMDSATMARAHRHLMSVAQLGREALLLNELGGLPGADLPMRAVVSTVRNHAGRITAVLALFRSHAAPQFRRRDGLLVDLLARRAAAVIEARYDALTGLFARHAFEPRVRALVAERAAGPWSLLYMDADRLHAINDQHGMQVGDRLLMKLGELIRARLAPGGCAARMSGDRFAILLPAAESDAIAFAEGLRASVAALSPASLGAGADVLLPSSLSIGVAPLKDDHADPVAGLRAAEAACRAAKRRGRNRVERFTPGGETTLVAQVGNMLPAMDADAVRHILEGGRLALHAQLIAPLPGCSAPTPHFELLLRVQDDGGNPVGPGRFLADARALGLMSAVDLWVVRETLAMLAPHAQLLVGGAVVLTVNISGQSLGEAAFAGQLLSMIRGSGVDPKALCFEFGEADVAEHLAAAESLMWELRNLGATIALDDFGTGTSSLADLRQLPLNILKIDGSFVRGLLTDPRAEAMVQGLTHLARSAGFTSVAECVETEDMRMRLAGMGVDFAQGFAVAKPVPLDEAVRDLPTWASVARQRQGSDIELGDLDDTVSAALQEQLQRELAASGLAQEETEEDTEALLARLFEGVPAADASDMSASAAQPGSDADALYPRRAAG